MKQASTMVAWMLGDLIECGMYFEGRAETNH